MGLRRWLRRLVGREDERDWTPVVAPPRSQPRMPQPGPPRRREAAPPDEPCGVVVVEPGDDPGTRPKPVQWRTVHVARGVRHVQPSGERPPPAAPVRSKRVPPPSILGNPWSNASVEEGRARGYERRSDDHD